MLNKIFNKNSDMEVNRNLGGVIKVIGYRSSGKTTFMAALARWPNASASSPVQSVSATNDNGQELIDKARNILEQGDQLEFTKLDADANEVKDYNFRITLKDKFSLRNPQLGMNNRIIDLDVSCKDYAGEFFTELLQSTNNSKLDSYLEDCVNADGIALLIDGSSNRMDAEYAMGIDKFIQALDRNEVETRQRRIAVVLTKAENGELFATRDKPAKTTMSNRFPQVHERLQRWHNSKAGRVDYFRSSAFGTLGNKFPEPNATIIRRGVEGTTAVIKKPRLWRPFGLISPFYWLCTGEHHPDLDKD
jgi:adenylate kinase family enzyme